MSAIPSRWSERYHGRSIGPLCAVLARMGMTPRFEVQFPWLFVPSQESATIEERHVATTLVHHATETIATLRSHIQQGARAAGRARKAECDGATVLSGLRKTLALDIWLPEKNVAIEFDERQHFSEERGVSLDTYPDREFPFDLNRWRGYCSINIYDPSPPGRDWQRAFRDAVRDLRCRSNGVKLLRIHYLDPIDRVEELLAQL